jgi:pimeloyl-ACP methyl ester carboxylesterase
MIEDEAGQIEYDEHGTGPTVVLVPGSCSTGAAWRPIMAAWHGHFRCVTTSLLGYGRTAERRTDGDPSICHETTALEMVIRRTGGPVHLVGHSFGALVALAVALRNQAPLASLTIIEAPAVELLRDRGEDEHYQTFRRMSDTYFAAYQHGNIEAVEAMIDFYGGTGTFASWPPKVRDYAVRTTSVNIVDWASAYGFPLSARSLAAIKLPALVIRGGSSPEAVRRANELVSQCIPDAKLVTVKGAAHFMIATHPDEVARSITRHVHRADLPSL